MKPSEHDRIEHLVNQAMELKPAERPVFLLGACGQDADLRQQVETLLRAAEEAEGFMEGVTTFDDSSMTEGPGTMIGRYKLLQKVGEGGMGAVYMAEQTEPVTRKVALKIIKLGMDTKQVVARFEAERQALAMMDHHHIAKVLDAGATDAGRPFFVMELVRGVPITEYCDKNKLSTKQRLELFIPVCHAIQHAHQKGVIHRDIKPSNVMVTLHDGAPVPKVIDFGIAKATHQKLTEKTLFTNFSQMIGTPAYMSPEQAEMSGLDVDTRTDVYSLGVLLYELLTGTTPFPTKELMSMGYGEMQRIIAEKEPPKPSTRMSTLEGEQRTTVAKNRSMEVSALGHLFKGDLDWIVMKSLEKDRSHRYETVNGLVSDIRRHLDNEPVSAAAPTFRYQLQKFYKKNTRQLQLGLAVALLLLLATIVSITSILRATNEKIRADQESMRGDTVAEFASGLIEKATPNWREGNLSQLRALLKDAESVALNTLQKAPAAEFQLLYQLLKPYDHIVRSHPDAFRVAQRLSELALTLDDSNMGGVTRLEIECLMATLTLWRSKVNDPDLEGNIQAVRDLAMRAQSSGSGKSLEASWCRTALASYLSVLDRDEEALTEIKSAWESWPTEETQSWVGPYMRYVGFNLYRGKYTEADLVAEFPMDFPLPEEPEPAFVKNFHEELDARVQFHLRAQTQMEEIRSFLLNMRKRMHEAKWSHVDEQHLDTLEAWLDLAEGRGNEAIDSAVRIASHPDTVFRTWQECMTIVMHGKRPEDDSSFESLRSLGLARYSNQLEQIPFLRLMFVVLSKPLAEPLADMLKHRFDMVEKANDLTNHWAAGFMPFVKGVLMFRKGEFEKAVDIFTVQLEYTQQRGIEPKTAMEAMLAENRAHRSITHLMRAYAFACMDDKDSALKDYHAADSILSGKAYDVRRTLFLVQDVYHEEVESYMRTKGYFDGEEQ